MSLEDEYTKVLFRNDEGLFETARLPLEINKLVLNKTQLFFYKLNMAG